MSSSHPKSHLPLLYLQPLCSHLHSPQPHQFASPQPHQTVSHQHHQLPSPHQLPESGDHIILILKAKGKTKTINKRNTYFLISIVAALK